MNRPGLTMAGALSILSRFGLASRSEMAVDLAIIGVRGYFLNTMGEPGKNDRGIYDDCIAVVSPNGIWTFNGNTDPSVYRKGIATLQPGVHPYRKGKHGLSKPGGGYHALRPATIGERLPVIRDPGVTDYGVAINIHKGSRNSTSSEGCQTLHPDQWDAFIKLVYGEMDRWKMKEVNYVLVANRGDIA